MQRIELSNQADSLFYSHQSTLRDNEGLIPEKLKIAAEEKKEELVQVLDDPKVDLGVLQTRLEGYRQAVLTMGAEVYNQGSSYRGESSSRDYETVGEEEITREATHSNFSRARETTNSDETFSPPQPKANKDTSELEAVFSTFDDPTQSSDVATPSDDAIDLGDASENTQTRFDLDDEDFNPFEEFEEFEEEDESWNDDFEAVE